jgi:Core-2/I-Branching enzyme
MQVGFVILSHNEPEMLLRLVQRLQALFDNPPIACHHDIHQVSLNTSAFPSVRFVAQPLRTRWGHISVVHAFRLALRLLYEGNPPDWFVLLSGSDYPIKSRETIDAELCSSPYDAYLDHRPIEFSILPENRCDGEFDKGFSRPFYVYIAYDRYLARRIRYPRIERPFRLRFGRYPIRHPWLAPGNPFTKAFHCFAGAVWFTARARCAELLLSNDSFTRELLAFYADKTAADESFVHTVLCNSPILKLCNNSKRYVDWSAGAAHPKLLGMEDLPLLSASPHHFARKFSTRYDVRILDELDRLVDHQNLKFSTAATLV